MPFALFPLDSCTTGWHPDGQHCSLVLGSGRCHGKTMPSIHTLVQVSTMPLRDLDQAVNSKHQCLDVN